MVYPVRACHKYEDKPIDEKKHIVYPLVQYKEN